MSMHPKTTKAIPCNRIDLNINQSDADVDECNSQPRKSIPLSILSMKQIDSVVKGPQVKNPLAQYSANAQ
jgi:hypothetical protein